MANSYFIVHNGLQVGPLTIDAVTGNITTTGTITSQNTTEVFGNVYADNYYFSNNQSISSAFSAPYDLDDISPYTDSVTNTFNLTYNQANVSVASPWNLTVALNGSLQSAFQYNNEVLWQSFILSGSKGYTVINNYWPNGSVQSGPLIKFADPLPRGTQVLLRSLSGSYIQSAKIYPFKAVDIVLGAD
jgi:hypothetical protein